MKSDKNRDPIVRSFVQPKEFRYLWIGSFFLVTAILGTHFWYFLKTGTFAFESGESYNDRLASYAMARSFQDYGFNFYDPYSRQEPVFYQHFLYWILGAIAGLFESQPWAVGNVLQLFSAPVFFTIFYKIGKEITGNRNVALLGTVLTFLYGSLEFLMTGEPAKLHLYGNFAVMFSFLRGTASFYNDTWGLLLGYCGFLFFWRLVQAPSLSSSKRNLIGYLVFGSMAYCSHLLPALYILLLCASALAAKALIDRVVQPKRLAMLLVPSFVLYGCILLYTDFIPPKSVMGALGAYLFLVFFWYSNRKPVFIVLIASLIPMAILSALNLRAVAGSGRDSLFYIDWIRTFDLSIPVFTFIGAYFPILFLAGCAFIKPMDRNRAIYFSFFLIVITAMVYNNVIGYNNHPYRYIPYTFPILCLLAAVGLRQVVHCQMPNLFKKGLLTGLGLLISLGIGQNLYAYYEYRAQFIRPINPFVFSTVNAIETIRSKKPDAVFYVQPSAVHSAYLAPYTGAKFFLRSVLGGPSLENSQSDLLDRTPSVDQIFEIIQSQKLKIDYVVFTGQPFTNPGGDAAKNLALNLNDIYIFEVPHADK